MTRVWFKSAVGMALFDHPVMFPEDGVQVHVNNVPATWEVNTVFVAVLLQICIEGGVFERSGVGNTVTT